MEDGVGVNRFSMNRAAFTVLILFLVEDGVGVKFDNFNIQNIE